MASNTYEAIKIEKAFIFDGSELKVSTDASDYVVDDSLIEALEESARLDRELKELEEEVNSDVDANGSNCDIQGFIL